MNSTSPRETWLDAAREFAAGASVPAWVVDDLMAFVSPHPRGGPPHPPELVWEQGFPALEAELAPPLDADALARLMAEEAEGRQPAMFARRLAAVEGLLAELDTPAARVLRVGLRVRLQGISEAPPPRLRRVRALADFYYSLAARLRHPEWVEDERHLEELVAGLRWRTVDTGIEHALIDGLADGMPVHVNVLRVDPDRVRIDVADLHEETRDGTPLQDVLRGRATAAVSGGFFLYSEDDIAPPSHRHDPVGLLLVEGVVDSPPVFRRAGLLVGDSGLDLRRVDMSDVQVRIDDAPFALARVWNRAGGQVGPDEATIAVVGGRVLASGRRLPVPLNGFVASLDGFQADSIRVGARVTYTPPRVGGHAARTGICGGPLLVEGGRPVLDMRAEDFWGTAPPITFSQDETGDRNMLARLALGVDDDGRLIAAAIDGRNVHRALGMTLADAARLMMLLGCHRAANMDGGSSKRMYVDGAIVDLPSTEIVAGESSVTRVRPVHTAILFRA